MKTERLEHKPISETLLNTAAIALTTSGVIMCQARDMFGFLMIFCGASLEFLKYYGRKSRLW